jgi:glycosyltransferase involved in cell wall biosynthesis
MGKRAVILITNIPTPYRLPLFNELSERLKSIGCELTVLFGAKCDNYRKWQIEDGEFKFNRHFLTSGKSRRKVLSYPGLIKKILKEKPDRIITIGFSVATLKLFLLSFWTSVKYVIWSGSIHNLHRRQRPIERLYRKVLCSRAEAAIAYGTLAKRYLIDLGMREERITIAINTVDTKFFENETNKLRKSPSRNDQKTHLLFVGYLIQGKGLEKLLVIVENLSKTEANFVLDIIGEGPDKEKIESYIARNALSRFVTLHGYVQKDHLPKYFAASRIFIFPTEIDIWGLVLVEAMAAGLACISSKDAGATFDLIKDGVNGFSADFDDYQSVIQKISYLVRHPDKAKEFGRKAQHFIREQASLERSCEGFLTALERL